MTLTLILIALVVGVIIGAKFGRVLLLLALIGAAGFALVNLPKILDVIGKAQAIAKLLGW